LTGHVVSLDTFNDPHLAAVLIKKYLRDLPEPLFPERMYSTIRRCPLPTEDPGDINTVEYVREVLLPQLPPCAYILLSNVLRKPCSLNVDCMLHLCCADGAYPDLMHEVSLRASANRMDAYNLAVVLCPNLVKGSNPLRDVQICAISGSNGHPSSTHALPVTSNGNGTNQPEEGKTTLGSIIKLCIQRYFEVFDEVWDRTEAVPVFQRPQDKSGMSSSSSSVSVPGQAVERSEGGQLHDDDEEELDDAMLVMPIGPGNRVDSGSPPSAYTPRHTTSRARGSSIARSMYTTADGTMSASPTLSKSKARSMISIEKGNGHAMGKKGSISIGRGTMRGKSAASGVEAMGITASGFFSPPSEAPPVPSLSSPRTTAGAAR
jgi:Rho GTPase-activating protein 1